MNNLVSEYIRSPQYLKSIENGSAKSVENVPAKSVENVPAKSVENVPVKSVENVPAKSVENAPAKSVENVPVKSVENVPAKSVEKGLAKLVENVPAKSVENGPAKSVENVPPKSENIPAKSVEKGPAKLVENAVKSIESGITKDSSVSLSNNPTEVSKEPVRPKLTSKSSTANLLLLLDFCYDVSSFKVSYNSKSIDRRLAAVEEIIQKYFKSPNIIRSVKPAYIDEVIEMKRSCTIKPEIFDKIQSDVAAVLNNKPSSNPPSNQPITSPKLNLPQNDVKKPTDVSYPLKSDSNQLDPVPNKTSSAQISIEPQQIQPSYPPASTPQPPLEYHRTISVDQMKPNNNAISIVLRRFEQKRGGVKVLVPDTIGELLQIATEKLKINAVCIREPATEAEITELNLFKQDMFVWVMTKEDEKQFL